MDVTMHTLKVEIRVFTEHVDGDPVVSLSVVRLAVGPRTLLATVVLLADAAALLHTQSTTTSLVILAEKQHANVSQGQICPENKIKINMNNYTERRISRYFTISLCRELSPTRMLKWPGHDRVQITCNTSSAYHVQHVMCHVVRRDSSAIKFDRGEIAFI